MKNPVSQLTTQRFFTWLIICAVSFAVRLITLNRYPFVQTEATHAYDTTFTPVFATGGYAVCARTAYRVYTHIMHNVFGPSTMPILVGNSVMGAFLAVLTGLVALRIVSRSTWAIYPACLAALNPIFVFWTGYVFPESMFLLVIILAIWLGFRWLERASLKRFISFLAIILLLPFTRAHGLVTAPLVLCWAIATRLKSQRLAQWLTSRKGRLSCLAVAIITVVFVTSLVIGTIVAVHSPPQQRTWPFRMLLRDFETPLNELHIRLNTPDQPEIVRAENAPFIMSDASNPWEHLRVACVKIRLFWIPVRPTFSPIHTILVLGFYGSLYILAISGWALIWQHRHRRNVLLLFLSLWLVFTIVAIINFPDAEGRYRLPCDILLLLLAGESTGHMLESISGLYRRSFQKYRLAR